MGVSKLQVLGQFQSLPGLASGRASDDGSLLFAVDDVKSSENFLRPSSVEVSPGLEGLQLKTIGALNDVVNGSQDRQEQLLSEIELAVSSIQPGDESDMEPAFHMARKLAEQGFHGQVVVESSKRRNCASNWKPSMPFRPFLLVTGYARGGEERTGLEVVVAADFRSKFTISSASPPYAAATALLPTAFVGRANDLEDIVLRMGKMMKREFAAKGMSLPPWRSSSALLAIWFPLEGRQGKPFAPA